MYDYFFIFSLGVQKKQNDKSWRFFNYIHIVEEYFLRVEVSILFLWVGGWILILILLNHIGSGF